MHFKNIIKYYKRENTLKSILQMVISKKKKLIVSVYIM